MHCVIDNRLTPDFLQSIRLAELTKIEEVLRNIVGAGVEILEIGAGTGWQARELAALGYRVTAIDIPTSNHGKARIWPIVDFDGSVIPFHDKSFDIVYSSNVLEHVEDFETLNKEISRVLRSDGTAVHYVPTSAWRAWSLAAFYPALVREVFRRFFSKVSKTGKGGIHPLDCELQDSKLHRSLLIKLIRRIVPHVHGVEGNCWTELLRFSRQSWDKVFTSSGWTVSSYSTNGFFLTGDMILGTWVSVAQRQRLSRIFGSSAHLYVLMHRKDAK
jgi:2-polyprenyl-3-methyl-5-hydroxy-6-metoxy-1,4-benzoquinol methylase